MILIGCLSAFGGFFLGAGLLHFISRNRLRKSRAREEMYCAILDHLPGYIFAKDAGDSFRYLFINQVCEKFSGFSRDQVKGRNDREMGWQNADSFQDQDGEILRTGIDFSSAEQLTDEAGKVVYAKFHRTLVTLPDGRKLIVGIGIDLTHERELEQKLVANIRDLDAHIRNERSINRCFAMISRTDDLQRSVPFFLRENSRLAGADRAVILLFDKDYAGLRPVSGWSRDEKKLSAKSFPLLQTVDFGQLHEVMRTRRVIGLEDTGNPPPGMETFAGKMREFRVGAVLSHGIFEDGKLIGIAAFDYLDPREFSENDHQRLRNVCNFYLLARDRDRRLSELRENAAFHRQIFDSITMPILLFDLDFNIVSVNHQTVVSTGIPEDQLLGHKCYKALCHLDQPPEWCPMMRTVADGGSSQIDFAGHGNQYIVTTHPVYNQDGAVGYVLETAFDVTAQKVQAREVRNLNQLMSSASELAHVTCFAGDAAANISIIGDRNIIGFPGEPGEVHSLAEWIVPEDRSSFDRERCTTVADGDYRLELIVRSDATGERRSYRLTAMRSKDNPELYLGVIQDITESLAREEERKELIKRLHNYVESERIVNACLSQIVTEDDFIRNTGEILKIVAMQFDCDRAFFGVFDETEEAFRFMGDWRREGIAFPVEAVELPRRLVEWRSRFLRDELLAVNGFGSRTLMCVPVWVGKRFFGVLGIAFNRQKREISELDKNILRSISRIIALAREHQLQREKFEAVDRQSSLIFNALPVPVALFSSERRIIRVNPALNTLTGLTDEELISRPCFESLCHVMDGPEDCPVTASVMKGSSQFREVQTNGRQINVVAMPIFDFDGSVKHVLECFIDVTEIQEGKRRLEVALTAAEAANRAKSFFFATMSHELRTPLNAVIGFSELLRNSELTEEERNEYLQSINLAGNSLLYLINDILDLSKLEADQVVLVPQETDIPALLDELRAVFKYKLQEKKLEFKLLYPGDFPRVKLDSQRLRQVLLNLIGNAVKFTPEGGITVTLTWQPLPGEGSFCDLAVSVRDTGIGISKEAQRTIFDPFVQQNVLRDTHVYKGTGLGLTITRHLVNRMGGSIRIESEPGEGSDFMVEFRRVEYAAPTVAKLAEEPESVVSMRRYRLLLVDDVDLNLKVLGKMLQGMGVECRTASSGAGALAILREDRAFDAVLTDMWMPEMNGAELAEAIRRDASCDGVRVVAVTADTDARSNFPDGKFAGFLLKPITGRKVEKMFRLLENSETGWNIV